MNNETDFEYVVLEYCKALGLDAETYDSETHIDDFLRDIVANAKQVYIPRMYECSQCHATLTIGELVGDNGKHRHYCDADAPTEDPGYEMQPVTYQSQYKLEQREIELMETLISNIKKENVTVGYETGNDAITKLIKNWEDNPG